MDKYSKAKRNLFVFLTLFILLLVAYCGVDWYLKKNNFMSVAAPWVGAVLLYLPIALFALMIVSVGNMLKYYKDGIYKSYSTYVLYSGYALLIWGLLVALNNTV